MANSPQARKRVRQHDKTRLLKMGQKAALRTAIKKVIAAILSGDKTAATTQFKNAVPIIDRGVGHGLIKKNTAARYKSRMNARVRALS